MTSLPERPRKVECWAVQTANFQTYATEEDAYLAEVGAWMENLLLNKVKECQEAGINSMRAGEELKFMLKHFAPEIIEVAKTLRRIRGVADG